MKKKPPEKDGHSIKNFLRRLDELQDEFDIRIEVNCTAYDDSGLESWIEYVRYIPKGKGRSRVILFGRYDEIKDIPDDLELNNDDEPNDGILGGF